MGPLPSLPSRERRPLRRHPTRRRVLPLAGLLLLVLLAGCSAAGSLSMDHVTDAEIVDRASRSVDRVPSDGGDDLEARTVRSAIENGSATVENPYPPVEEGQPFAYDGAYYDLTWEVVDERTETSVSLLVEYNASDLDGERVAFADLPAADQRAVDALLPPRGDRDVEGYDLGASTTYNDSELDRSVLVSNGRTIVVFEGEAYPVKFDGTSQYTIETYRYTATKVADSREEYARALKDEHLFVLQGLTDAERAVVDEAVEEGSYYAESDDDEAFRAVLAEFRRHEAVESGEAYGVWIVRYDGEVHWADLRYEGFRSSGSSANSGSGQEDQVEQG